MHRHTVSFKHAFDGIYYAFTTQPNFRFHLFIAIFVTILAVALQVSSIHWLLLIFTYTWVITAEMINTSLEAIVDLASPGQHQLAKVAKDTAAGMVLITAIGAVIIGLIIFIPYILEIS